MAAREVQTCQPGGGKERAEQVADDATAGSRRLHHDRNAENDQRERSDGYRETVEAHTEGAEAETTITLQGASPYPLIPRTSIASDCGER
jgi:hypothetical protein